MGNRMLAVFIICVPFLAKGFPLSDTFNDVLESRDIVSDYLTSWFWSPTSTEEPNDGGDSKPEEKSNIRLDEKARDAEKSKSEKDIKNMSVESNTKELNNPSIPGTIEPLQEIPDSVQTENIADLLETIKDEMNDSDVEEKLGTFNFLQKLKDTVTTNPAPYVQVMYKKVKHFISIGTLGDSKRIRCGGLFMTPWWIGIIQMIFGSLFGMLGQPPKTNATNQVGLYNNWLGGLFGLGPALQTAQTQFTTPTPQHQFNLFGQIDPSGQTITKIANPNTGTQFQGLNPFGNLTGLVDQMNPSSNNINLLMLLLLLVNQLKDGSNTPNNDIIKIITKLQGNPNNSNVDISKLLTSLQKNPNISNNDLNKVFTTLIGKSNNPNQQISIDDHIPRVFVVKDNPADLDLDFDDDDSMKIFQITGSPEDRLKKIRRNYERNPDLSQKVILINELNRLRNRIGQNSPLYPEIIDLYDTIKRDPRYQTAITVERQNDGDEPRQYNNIVFLDDKGNRISRDSLNDDFVQKILNKISNSVQNNQIRNFDDPEARRKFYSDIKLYSL